MASTNFVIYLLKVFTSHFKRLSTSDKAGILAELLSTRSDTDDNLVNEQNNTAII